PVFLETIDNGAVVTTSAGPRIIFDATGLVTNYPQPTAACPPVITGLDDVSGRRPDRDGHPAHELSQHGRGAAGWRSEGHQGVAEGGRGVRRPRALLADDHALVVEGLRHLLEGEFELVGTVEDGRALSAAAQQLQPDG